MEHQLYKLPDGARLPVFIESGQQFQWSENELEEATILLYLRDFDLKEENLTSSWRVPTVLTAGVNYFFGQIGRSPVAMLSIPVTMSQLKAMYGVVSLRSDTSLEREREAFVKACKGASQEFEETGRVEGKLFLTPDFQKVWLSHYDIKCLKKIS